jgi:uncharacterized integral membrane protein
MPSGSVASGTGEPPAPIRRGDLMLEQNEKGSKRTAIPRLIIAGVALVVVAMLLAQNSEQVHLTAAFWTLSLPLWLALLLMVLLGAGLGQAIGMWRSRR